METVSYAGLFARSLSSNLKLRRVGYYEFARDISAYLKIAREFGFLCHTERKILQR